MVEVLKINWNVETENGVIPLSIRIRLLVCRTILASAALNVGIATHCVSAGEVKEGTNGFSVYENLRYSPNDRELGLDLFVPESNGKPVACVVVIQGGGFIARDGQRFRHYAVYLAEHGFAAALIGYRGRPNHEYRDTIADTRAAVRYVRKVSGQHNIAPDRIGAMGGSAGGALAALLAVAGNSDQYLGNSDTDFSSRIQAAVTFAGVFNFVSRFSDERQMALQPRLQEKIITNGEWIGTPFSPEDKHWLAASAINHVDAADPPMLLMHCKDDQSVPWLQSQEMFESLKAAGVDAELKLYDTGGHGFKGRGDIRKVEMVRFFKRTLQSTGK